MPDLTVIFDVDGTLVDSQAMFTETMAGAFAAEGLPPPDPATALALVGISLPELVAMLLPQAGAARQAAVTAAYRRLYGAAAAGRAVPYPGADAGLRRLRAAGVTLAIATGKSRRGLDRLLAREGWGPLFATTQCADDHPSKPHPSMVLRALTETGAPPDRAVMVGDTTFDVEMAAAAGVATIGVTWGYHPAAAAPSAAGAVAVAEDFDDLVARLDGTTA